MEMAYHQLQYMGMIEKKFRSLTSDNSIWTVEKQSRVVKSAERRCNSAKVRRKKIHPRQMLEKSRNAAFFHDSCVGTVEK